MHPDLITTPQTPITLANVYDRLVSGETLVIRRRFFHPKKWRDFELLENVDIQLSDGSIIQIQSGFQWDLSSVPKFLWSVLPPDGDFECSSLIHDFIYQKKPINSITWKPYTRAFADKEMLKWARVLTPNKKFDNWIRYIGVRIGGGFVWR